MRRLRFRKRRKANGYSVQNKIKLVRGGKPYFDQIIEMINRAEKIIQFQVYIFDYDETGKAVADALIAAAKRKVQIYLMADGYASQSLPKSFLHETEQSGIHFRFFEPLFKSRNSYFGRRMHHKVVVVDNRFALVGGVNISNHYNDLANQPGWLDFALFMEGEVTNELCRVCEEVWNGYLPIKPVHLCNHKEVSFDIPPDKFCEVRVRRNDWITKKNQVSRSYIEMFNKAEDHIIMMSGYFLPGPVIRRNMKRAAARGVKIKLILAGMSDVMVAKYAERYMYNWIFRNHIELFEYKPCVLHGKVSTYDKKWATIGSYNVNIISAYASLELNIDVNDPGFAGMLDDTMQKIIQNDCVQVTKENFTSHNGIFNKIWELICYWFVRLLFYLFTINFKQRS
ncbi:MAG TPA: phospholipase D-like domain-containing protein [Puia sp.]|jgi:cardiolipin synthase